MKIDKYEKKQKGKYRLYLDNGEVIDTYDDVIIKNELLLKGELDLITYNKVLTDSAIYEKYNACIKYITVRVRSKKEIIDYLKLEDKSKVKEIIKDLEEKIILRKLNNNEKDIKEYLNNNYK